MESKRVNYTLSLRDRESGIGMGYKKGKIRIKENDNIDTVMAKLKDKHELNPDLLLECRLHNFTFKPKTK
jgi:hypothetical protein